MNMGIWPLRCRISSGSYMEVSAPLNIGFYSEARNIMEIRDAAMPRIRLSDCCSNRLADIGRVTAATKVGSIRALY